jgi:hypothetical protein
LEGSIGAAEGATERVPEVREVLRRPKKAQEQLDCNMDHLCFLFFLILDHWLAINRSIPFISLAFDSIT